MINREQFVSKKFFYLIWILEKVFRLFFLLLRYTNMVPVNPGTRNRVLIIEPTHLGDVLLTTPALRFLKEAKRDLDIFCLVSSSGKYGILNNEHINGIRVVDLPWYDSQKKNIFSFTSFVRLVRVMQEVNPEFAINVRSASYHREHLAMWIAGIPNRVGFSHKGFGFLLSQEIPFPGIQLAAKQKIDLISFWIGKITNNYPLKPVFFISDKSVRKIAELFGKLNLKPNRLLVGINPCAQHTFLWPVEYYVDLIKLLHDRFDAQIIFLGVNSFKEFVVRIQNQLNFETSSLVGMSTLEELGAILEKLDLLITVDTGIRHIASTVEVPTFVLRNGANSSIEFGKYVDTEKLISYEVPCSPCGKIECPMGTLDCMMKITPEVVFSNIVAHLSLPKQLILS